METLMLWIGRVAGVSGALICAAAVLGRFTGNWHVGSYPIGTLLQGGMAAMLIACLSYLALIAERTRR